jgi:hypothetical protein
MALYICFVAQVTGRGDDSVARSVPFDVIKTID